jgi:hypothetical protein
MRPSQNGSQPALDSKIPSLSLGKTLQYAGKNKMPERRHVVAGETQCVDPGSVWRA